MICKNAWNEEISPPWTVLPWATVHLWKVGGKKVWCFFLWRIGRFFFWVEKVRCFQERKGVGFESTFFLCVLLLFVWNNVFFVSNIRGGDFGLLSVWTKNLRKDDVWRSVFWQHNRVYMFYLKLSHAIFLWDHCVLVTANHTSHTDTEILAPVSSIIYSLWFQKIFFVISTTLTFAEIDPIWRKKHWVSRLAPMPGSSGKLSFKQHFGEGILDGLLEGEMSCWNPVFGGLEPQLETNP